MFKEKTYKKTKKKTVEEKQTATTKTVTHVTEVEVVRTQKKKSGTTTSNSFQWRDAVNWVFRLGTLIISLFKG
ncbi:hypothetical protein WNE24_25270 [Bacillus thuringiensis]|jgi:hypothetical protein|uniref:hypothetical protein n=1 Tax=Bacillus thuringiensis TaxID=1428 RepID=UPI0031016617